jgi:hypothetical protein
MGTTGAVAGATVALGGGAAGTVIMLPQILHLADRPANSSGTRNVFPHWLHVNAIMDARSYRRGTPDTMTGVRHPSFAM